MSNDTAECGCEGHVSNFDECRYPALKARVAALEKELDDAVLVVDRVRGSLADAGVPAAVSPQEWLRVSWLSNERRKAESERDAALADNAALLRVIRLNAGGGPEGTCLECGMGNGNHFPECVTGRAAGHPHSGDALLEEHRKALDEERVRWISEMKAQHAEWRKALVRARNKGLEKAAQASDDAADEAEARAETASASPNPDAANWDNGAANEARNIATRIRAMKEPEPTEPA